ncbi:hypothetical protein ASE43_09675 [Lysobacter sp. Root983]|nr:hypothetical protein ASE43_09675 [Lysobacter sp. Root983]
MSVPSKPRPPGLSRVEDCVRWARRRIEGEVLRPGMRLPSVRALARQRGVSPFTVVEAYERLVADGYLEARRGSGFYVRERAVAAPAWEPPAGSVIDLDWLMQNMLESGAAQGPGLGVLPASWLDGAQLGAAIRALGREGRWLDSGKPHGYGPLRSLLQQRLAELDILAQPDQIVLTTGVAHALNLVLAALVKPGDAVLTLDPCWFGALGIVAAHGARVVGIACGADGPDLAELERRMAQERPRLMVLSTAARNPTGLSLPESIVVRILALAARHDVTVFEDDVYADLCGTRVTRAAALDRLDRVVYAGSFSKTLAANVRVGYLAANAELARKLTNAKILTGFTTPELNERLVHKLLAERRYDKHVEGLRERLAGQRELAKRLFAAEGVEILGDPADGMFLWADMRADTNRLAVRCREQGILIAPGSLFTAQQAPSTWMRFNVTAQVDKRMRDLLFA